MEHFGLDQARVMIGGANFRTIHSGNWDSERRIRDLEQHGIAAQVISPMPELLSYWSAPQDAPDYYPYLTPEKPADRTLQSLGLPPHISEDITWHNCWRFLGSRRPLSRRPSKNGLCAEPGGS
jgi:hypothetical protein